jgi:uroporphyrinogen-III synthase
MLEERGAEAVPCPMIAIRDAPDRTCSGLATLVRKGMCDDLVLMTGEGLRRLLGLARAPSWSQLSQRAPRPADHARAETGPERSARSV